MNTHDIELPKPAVVAVSDDHTRWITVRNKDYFTRDQVLEAIEANRKRRGPFTVEKIRIIWKETQARMGAGGDPVLWFARAIERAHGISAPQPAEPVKVNAIFETQDDEVIGTTDAKVKRVEWQDDGSLTVVIDYWPQPAEPVSQHPDDVAVDAFTTAMKAKLKRAREEKGRGGWQDMSATVLSDMLREHVEKGDPVDVANLAMMLHQNGQGIAPAEPVKYWLCCGSTDPTHADRKQPDCYDPDKAKFETAESHKDSPAEPVKRKRRYAQGTALGEFGVIPMCDQVDDEPVKVPSDEDLLDMWEEIAGSGKSDEALEFAYALLDRYGQQPKDQSK